MHLALEENSVLSALMFAIMDPMLPTMEANIRTPTRKLRVTKRNSDSWTGWLKKWLQCNTGGPGKPGLPDSCEGEGAPPETEDVLALKYDKRSVGF